MTSQLWAVPLPSLNALEFESAMRCSKSAANFFSILSTRRSKYDASESELKSIENRSCSKLPGVDDSGSVSVNFMINVEGIGDLLNRWLKQFRLGIA